MVSNVDHRLRTAGGRLVTVSVWVGLVLIEETMLLYGVSQAMLHGKNICKLTLLK